MALVGFDLGRRFDAVLCLGSATGYVATLERLHRAVATLARHTAPGGVVVVEPWFTPETWEDGRLTAGLVDQPALKIVRVLVSGRRRRSLRSISTTWWVAPRTWKPLPSTSAWVSSRMTRTCRHLAPQRWK